MYLISGKIPVTNTDTQDGTGWFDTDVYRNIWPACLLFVKVMFYGINE